MSFELIALAVLFGTWALCGALTWVAFSVATRGNAGLGMLPLAMFAACVVPPLVPILGLEDGRGLALSYLVAVVAPAALLALRRFAMPLPAGVPTAHQSEAE